MSLLLKGRDYAPDGNGGVAAVQGAEELLEEALFRLTTRRGSFPFLPELGSRMHLLRREKPSEWDALAMQFAVEALDGLDGAAVTEAAVRRDGDGLLLDVSLAWQGEELSLTAELEG